ncbi:hypothetical protein MOO46_04780 [Apilactobacillus apisilvae]|uniref:Uncharacterized protein n=1 Tax=Apilactobacillus apisilvae TaxID=2923364 RepID=A0ABY4PJC9_9LACO|nr:hypothetical protein [Apilactobacillus apisilvae]UQS85765.1 hypothetical protein MOO46_04780 [Apilactobacillus apisilvae]
MVSLQKNIQPLRKNNNHKSLKNYEINLNTRLYNSGFKLNNEARKFFADYFKVDKFHFNKAMAVKMREVQSKKDKNSTINDLISVMNDNKIIDRTNEESTYQWNNFIKDFYQDSSYHNFISPIKVAAILWKKVRDSDQPKLYNHNLIYKHFSLIKKYQKQTGC